MATTNMSAVLSDLKTLCSRCVLRYSTADIKTKFSDVADTNQPHCGLCLGILEQKQIEQTIGLVSSQLLSEGYKTNTFSLAISLPQCMVLRQRGMLTYLKNNDLFSTDLHTPQKNDNLNIKEVLKTIIVSEIQTSTKKKFSNKSSLLVKVEYCYDKEVKEIKMIDSLLPKPSRKRRFQHKNNKSNQKSPLNSIQLITDTVNAIPDSNVKQYTSVPPETIESPCEIKIRITHETIYIAGRYNKYSRELSQTPWIIDGERKTKDSVQELICEKLMAFVGSKEVKFMSSGREDCDVRMLGRGRPFVVGLMDPKLDFISHAEVQNLQKEINSSTSLVAVRDLQLIDKDGLALLKSGEEEKTKRYSAKVWCPEPVDEEKIKNLNLLSEIKIGQNTPLRVLHRRPICVRERMVYYIQMERSDDIGHYHLKLKTQAGTYIKEFVHGDFGRTVPSLRSLMDAPFDILELDVDEVELDWPPKLEEAMEEKIPDIEQQPSLEVKQQKLESAVEEKPKTEE